MRSWGVLFFAATAVLTTNEALLAQDAVPEAAIQGPSGQETYTLQVTGVNGVRYFCRPNTRFNAELNRVERPCRRAESFASAQGGAMGDPFSGLDVLSSGAVLAVAGGVALVLSGGLSVGGGAEGEGGADGLDADSSPPASAASGTN